MKKRIIPQIKVVPHSSNRLYGIEFHTQYLSFQDFYSANKNAFPKFNEFNQVISLFLHNVYEELRKTENHNDFFPDYCIRIAKKPNPYTEYFLPIEWQRQLVLSNITSNAKFNRIFTSILSFYFPNFPFRHFSKDTWKKVFWYVSGGHRLQSTVDYLLRYAWWQVHGKLDYCNDDSYGYYRPITRHIAWCENGHKGKCLKFDFECHSSVNCPFYRESSLKKQNQ